MAPETPRTPPQRLTDRAQLARQRARAARAPALFLHEAAADDVQQRLSEVNRAFTRPAVITPFGAPFAAPWAALLPEALFVPEAETLALAPAAHDLVIHALSLHWADDPVGQIIQCRRALAPDGLFIGVLFGGRSLAELRAVLAEAEAAVMGGLSPRVLPMGDLRDWGALLQRAGLALPVADTLTLNVHYASAFRLMHDLRAMGEGNALAARHRRAPPRRLFAEAARLYAAHHATADGAVRAGVEMIFLSGWAPAPSQPKPARPGSATHRLADALGTPETRLPPKPDTARD